MKTILTLTGTKDALEAFKRYFEGPPAIEAVEIEDSGDSLTVTVHERDAEFIKYAATKFDCAATEERPEFITDEDERLYLDFLDTLRESGVTNMLGAIPYLLDEFVELSKDQAKQVLFYWMHSFSERH